MSKKLRRTADLPFQKLLDEVVIVAPRERRVHRLDEVAAHVWLQLEKLCTIDDLVRAVTEEFEVDPKEARRDLVAFLDELKEKGLVR